MTSFYRLLVNHFISKLTLDLVWFGLTLWVYIQTQSVLVTSLMYGAYALVVALTGIWFGTLIDHHHKKKMLALSNGLSLAAFSVGFILYSAYPAADFTQSDNVHLWALISTIFLGVLAGNIRSIALPALTTLMVPLEQRDKVNGLSGTLNGVSFLVASVASGFLISLSGIFWILMLALVSLTGVLIHLKFISIQERKIVHSEALPQTFNPRATYQVLKTIPGLVGLMFFNVLNNFLNGVFMPLIDPYGLSLMSVQSWGVLWGVLSLGFIGGGLIIAKKGLGHSPLKTLFLANMVGWAISVIFAIQPSVILLSLGILIWIISSPFIEAAEQTVLQKLVPESHQGRAFGFTQSLEAAASPLMTLLIGPLAQFYFIPFMTTGNGVEWIGGWFGVGEGRGIALIFILAGILGSLITLLAMRTRSYKLLSEKYLEDSLNAPPLLSPARSR